MSKLVDALLARLAEASPRLAGMLAEHRERFEEQAPRAFLRTAAFVTAAGYQSEAPDHAGEFQQVLDVLEAEVGTDEDLDGLIAESFLANVPLDDDPRGSVRSLLGPKLLGLLDRRPSQSPSQAGVHRLVTAEPALADDLNEHLDTYEGLLPHLFMGELIDRLLEWLGDGDEADAARVRTVLAALDDEYGRNFEVDELIAASFVEDLPEAGEDSGLLVLLGPKLKKELNRQRG